MYPSILIPYWLHFFSPPFYFLFCCCCCCCLVDYLLTLDTKVSRVKAATVFSCRPFQSLTVRGKKDAPLYCVLHAMSWNYLLCERLRRLGSGFSFDPIIGQWARLVCILKSMERREICLRWSRDCHPRVSIIWLTLELRCCVVPIHHKASSSSLNWFQLVNIFLCWRVPYTRGVFKHRSDNALYALSLMVLELIFRFLLRKPIVLLFNKE